MDASVLDLCALAAMHLCIVDGNVTFDNSAVDEVFDMRSRRMIIEDDERFIKLLLTGVIYRFLKLQGSRWNGGAAELLEELKGITSLHLQASVWWPKTPKQLARFLRDRRRRLDSEYGVQIMFLPPSNGRRLIIMQMVAPAGEEREPTESTVAV